MSYFQETAQVIDLPRHYTEAHALSKINRGMTFKELKQQLYGAQEIALCLTRKWWRPCVCIGMGGSLITNGIVIPLWTHTAADMTGLAALCASLAPFAWLRTIEKREGTSQNV